MLTNYRISKVSFLAGLFVLGLSLSFGACSSSSATPNPGSGGSGGKAGGTAGGSAGATGSAGSDGGGAGATGTAGSDGGGAGATGTAGSDGGTGDTGDGGALTPEQTHLMLINATTTGGVTITRIAPKDYATCK